MVEGVMERGCFAILCSGKKERYPGGADKAQAAIQLNIAVVKMHAVLYVLQSSQSMSGIQSVKTLD